MSSDVHMRAHTHIHICTHTCLHVNTHAYMHTHIHTCTHTYTHAHICTYMHTQPKLKITINLNEERWKVGRTEQAGIETGLTIQAGGKQAANI